MGYLYRFAYIQSFLLKKREQITLLLFFSRPRLLFFFLHHRKKSKQNKQLMLCVGAGTQKEKKKQPKNFSSASFCDQNFSSAFALKKTPKSFPLDTQYASKKTKEMVKITKSTRSLFLSCGSFSLLLSLSFVPMLRFLRVRILSLSPFKMRLCVRLCARVCVCLERPDLRLGVLFPSQPQVFFSCALICADFVSSLYHLFIQFAASAPATSADRPWP